MNCFVFKQIFTWTDMGSLESVKLQQHFGIDQVYDF